jgi:DNA invertase Pin-like site-specific DNA recombinase
VSPDGKSESVDAQARQLTKAGCGKVFRDVHVSGAKTDRAQLRRVIEALEPDDVLIVTRLDRLARPYAANLCSKKALCFQAPNFVANLLRPTNIRFELMHYV